MKGDGSRVGLNVKHGLTNSTEKDVLADCDPTVPVISNVYWPGGTLTMSYEVKTKEPERVSKSVLDLSSLILQRSILGPDVT